jgi:hypothetical protein
MIAIKIAWVIANTIVAIWFSIPVLMNHIPSVVRHKCGDLTFLLTIIISFSINIVLALAVCLYVSAAIGVVVTSVVAYSWGLISYFLLQRFAQVMDRPHTFRSNPMLYPLATFIYFLSSTLAISFFADWRLAFLPFVLWLIFGFLFAEIAIRSYMRMSKRMGRECDRDLAIFAINDAQGRNLTRNNIISRLKHNRSPYPFP